MADLGILNLHVTHLITRHHPRLRNRHPCDAFAGFWWAECQQSLVRDSFAIRYCCLVVAPLLQGGAAEIEGSSHLTRGRDHHQSPAVSESGAESRGCAHSTERAHSERGYPAQEAQSHEADKGFKGETAGE